MSAILLVRHGSAGSRARWDGDDALRPLDKRGRRQAKHLLAVLAPYSIGRILTSPYARCVQTVEPLAHRRGIPIEERDELAEGSPPEAVLELLEEVAGDVPLLCSHGDVIHDLVGLERTAQKGSTWILERSGRSFAPAAYLPPGP